MTIININPGISFVDYGHIGTMDGNCVLNK